ncbi:hypothetical protein PLIIFM63780_009888 [Purpureocillium lilacinum]|nr:hypothetical protein PLIIFM63780_009888 [Purpureocillium lilacinum]
MEAASNSTELDFTSWKALLATLETDWKSFRYRVGTGGDTGTGKSSLINALINPATDVIPTSQNGACTAAMCRFEYPKDGNRAKYSATISLKSKKTVDDEITAFFKEYMEFEDRAKLEGEDTVTRGEREKYLMQLRVISSWSGLTEDELLDLGRRKLASKISTKSHDCNQIFNLREHSEGIEINISKEKPDEFLLAVNPWVGSAGCQNPVRWPLVESVTVFIRAELLENGGIVLMDLPGEADSLESRSQVAKNAYQSLYQLLVVTPGDRALDNRTAMELIRDDQILDMETQCKISNHSIGIAVTKIDQMNWQTFLKSEWPDKEVPAELAAASGKFDTVQRSITETKGKIKHFKAVRQTNTDSWSPGELSTAKRQLRKLKKESNELQVNCRRQCIEARSQHTKQAFQRYFDDVRNQARSKTDPKVVTDLHVFPVSSHAQQGLAKDSPLGSFPDVQSTGFEALREWIIQGSLPKREAHADAILQRCHVLLDAVEGWAGYERQRVARLDESHLGAISMELTEEQSQLRSIYATKQLEETTEKFNKATKQDQQARNLFDVGEIMSLNQTFVKLVDNFQKSATARLHWFFWAPFALKWGQSFGPSLQNRFKRLEANVQAEVSRHIFAVSQSSKLPEVYKSLFRTRAYRVENLMCEYKSSVRASVSQYVMKGREIRSSSLDQLDNDFAPAYSEAQDVEGKGKMEGQAKAMRTHAARIRQSNVFTDRTKQIDSKVNKARRALAEELTLHATTLIKGIEEFEHNLARDVCFVGTEQSEKAKCDTGLKNIIQNELSAWRLFWTPLKARLPESDPPEEDGDGLEDCENETKTKDKLNHVDHQSSIQQIPVRSAVPRKRASKTASSGPKKAAKRTADDGVRGVVLGKGQDQE